MSQPAGRARRADNPGCGYVWYQFRLTMMAKGLIDAAGPNMLRRLWDAFALSHEQLAGVPGDRVHPTAGQWLASWSELQAAG